MTPEPSQSEPTVKEALPVTPSVEVKVDPLTETGDSASTPVATTLPAVEEAKAEPVEDSSAQDSHAVTPGEAEAQPAKTADPPSADNTAEALVEPTKPVDSTETATQVEAKPESTSTESLVEQVASPVDADAPTPTTPKPPLPKRSMARGASRGASPQPPTLPARSELARLPPPKRVLHDAPVLKSPKPPTLPPRQPSAMGIPWEDRVWADVVRAREALFWVRMGASLPSNAALH